MERHTPAAVLQLKYLSLRMQAAQPAAKKRDLLVLENKYHIGDKFYASNGSIDHKGLLIDRLFGDKPARDQLPAKPKPNFCAVESSLRRLC